MKFTLPDLPYDKDALNPHISPETLDYHYGKHHQKYVDNLNDLIKDSKYEDMNLEEIINNSEGGLFNNAAQTWNHTFFWNCMSPNGGSKPGGKVMQAIEKSFGSFEDFKDKFTKEASTLFGSGWTWLTQKSDGGLDIVSLSNAGNPMTKDLNPILTIDVWEHAYYIDYRNARPKFIEHFWELVNWDFAEKNMK